jgi:hypothetical protein
MSEAEVERLFRAIEALRLDVQEYRQDLHELEKKLVEMEARENQRSMSKAQIYKVIVLACTLVSTTTAVMMNVLDRI